MENNTPRNLDHYMRRARTERSIAFHSLVTQRIFDLAKNKVNMR